MNVTDQWMLERMQQMAASMAASVPQTGQNMDTPKTEKGDSFQDLMNKAKDQKVEAPKKTEAPEKPAATQKTQQPEKVDTRKVEVTKNPDGTETKTVPLTEQEAAAIAAGYAVLFPPQEDGTVSLGIPVGEGSPENNPLVDQLLVDKATGAEPDYAFQATLTEDGQWVLEPSEDLRSALEQFLEAADDPRTADSILDSMKTTVQENQNTFAASVDEAMQAQNDGQEEDDASLDAQDLSASQPLFKDVKAAPVKVGENFELDTQQADMDQQLADTIELAAQQGLKQIEIKLSPENLGALTIKLTQSTDGALQVILHAANSKAANLLSQHLDGLNAALQGYSQHSEVQVQVQRGEDSQQAQQQHQQTDADGHNRQNQQQQQQQDHSRSEDFIQRLRLGLFGLDDVL